ncbi:MAG: 2Fe-2S iron-sulfur cluster-binding protein [Bdellovibrio sp.]
MPKCTINGREVEFKAGQTIIEAMNEHGLRIAHYCWHPGLSVAGVCRLCMVEIEGNPRLQIACNTQITEGMKINNTSEKVKEAAKWDLDFHLINHPLDCPICDQAGECGLQDQYMEFGKYDPEMAEKKVKKKKVVDLGPTVVLDSERCILCSRCVRFTEEVSKTNELGIFDRGDRAEIGTFDGKPLDNKYSLNTVDICPVGALTSKDFRFRQRVWYLKDADSICTGCSTGCSVKVYFNKEGFYRVKPRFNAQVNGYWMCDEGRDIYKFLNRDARLLKAQKREASGWTELLPGAAAKEASSRILAPGARVAVVVTGQYSNEEYEDLFTNLKSKLKNLSVYYWNSSSGQEQEFDGILLRGDRNPNTRGLQQSLAQHSLGSDWKELSQKIHKKELDVLLVVGPENLASATDFSEKVDLFSQVPELIWLQAGKHEKLAQIKSSVLLIPLKTYVEKDGTYINQAGLAQKIKKVTTVVSEALTLSEASALLTGQKLLLRSTSDQFVESQRQADRVMLENRKKNEFVFRRGTL